MRKHGEKTALTTRWLMSGKPLTPLQSLLKFGYYRLSDLVYKINKRAGRELIKNRAKKNHHAIYQHV